MSHKMTTVKDKNLDRWVTAITAKGYVKPLCYGYGDTERESQDDAIAQLEVDNSESLSCKTTPKRSLYERMDDIIEFLESGESGFTISANNPNIAGLGYEIDPNSNYTIAQHASHLQKLMTGLIEKAKREGLDGRLLAMANTDFERGFMALEKAINTNKE